MKALPRGRRGEPCDLTAFRQWVEDPPRYVGIESRWDSCSRYCHMFFAIECVDWSGRGG